MVRRIGLLGRSAGSVVQRRAPPGLVVLAVLLGLAGVARASDCASQPSAPQVVALLEQAEGAYGDLDTAAFFSSFERARAALRCVAEPLTEPQAAHAHRVYGIAAYIRGDDGVVAQHMAAAASLDPDYRFPASVVAPGHRLNRLLDEGAEREPARDPVAEPAAGRLIFDGRVGAARPRGVPTVFQWVDEGELVRSTSYLMSSDPLPTYPLLPSAFKPAWKRSSVPWLVAGLGVATAAGLYGGAWGTQRRFDGLDRADFATNATYNAELELLKQRNNSLLIGAAGAGALAAIGLSVGIAGRF